MIIEEQISNFKMNPGKSGPVVNPGSYGGDMPQGNIYQKAVSQGYGDASRKIPGIGKKPRGVRDEILIEISKKIKDYFEQESNIASQSDYDTWHEDLCKSIVSDFDSKLSLTIHFGIAQKIVNMAFKYLRCFYVDSLELKNEKFKYCHCPIDTIICKNIIILSNNYDVSKEEYIALLNVIDSETTPWSKLDYTTYKYLQKIVNSVAKQILKYDESKLERFGKELGVSNVSLTSAELARQIDYFNKNGVSQLDIDILLWQR